MTHEQDPVETFLRQSPASPAWLEIRAAAPAARARPPGGALVTVHGAEVVTEERVFSTSFLLDGSFDRITVEVQVRPPLEDERHFEPTLRLVEAALRRRPSCAVYLDDEDRVVARASACFRHLGLSPRLLQNTTEEAIMEARTIGDLLDLVLTGELSLDDALDALTAEP